MRLKVDEKIEIEKDACRICLKTDDDWRMYQFLADGIWRRFEKDLTLRQQGIDEEDDARLYLFHGCLEQAVIELASTSEITSFIMSLREA